MELIETSELMTMEEIFASLEKLRGDTAKLLEAVRDSLDYTNIDGVTVELGDNVKIDKLFEMREKLGTVLRVLG